MLASRWVKISQCRFCGKVIFRHSGASINRWRFVRPKSSLIARIREEQSTWMFSTVPFNNDTRLKLTAIEKVLLDRDNHNTWIDDLLEKGGSLVTTGD
jgi:hypothetical protein